MSVPMNTIGQRLAFALNARKNTSASQLARDLKVTRGAVDNWLKDRNAPSSENLLEAAFVLEVNFAWLSTGRGEPFDFYITSAMRHIPALADRIAALRLNEIKGPFSGDIVYTVALLPVELNHPFAEEIYPTNVFGRETILVNSDKRFPHVEPKAYRMVGKYMEAAGISDTNILIGMPPMVSLFTGQIVAMSHYTGGDRELSIRQVTVQGSECHFSTCPIDGLGHKIKTAVPPRPDWNGKGTGLAGSDETGQQIEIHATIVRVIRDLAI